MLVAFVGFEASSVIVVVTVLEPLWGDFIYQVSYLAVVVPVLHQTNEAIDGGEEMLELRGISQSIPLSYSHPAIPYGPVIGIDSIILDMHSEKAHTL